MYVYIGYSKKEKTFIHQSILFTTHLKLFYIFYRYIYDKIVITIML